MYLKWCQGSWEAMVSDPKEAHCSPFWRSPTAPGSFISCRVQQTLPTPVEESPTVALVSALLTALWLEQVLFQKRRQLYQAWIEAKKNLLLRIRMFWEVWFIWWLFDEIRPSPAETGINCVFWHCSTLEMEVGIDCHEKSIKPSERDKGSARWTNGQQLTPYLWEPYPSLREDSLQVVDMQGRAWNTRPPAFPLSQWDHGHGHTSSTSWGGAIRERSAWIAHNDPINHNFRMNYHNR